jgi:hypothetical protein
MAPKRQETDDEMLAVVGDQSGSVRVDAGGDGVSPRGGSDFLPWG